MPILLCRAIWASRTAAAPAFCLFVQIFAALLRIQRSNRRLPVGVDTCEHFDPPLCLLQGAKTLLEEFDSLFIFTESVLQT